MAGGLKVGERVALVQIPPPAPFFFSDSHVDSHVGLYRALYRGHREHREIHPEGQGARRPGSTRAGRVPGPGAVGAKKSGEPKPPALFS